MGVSPRRGDAGPDVRLPNNQLAQPPLRSEYLDKFVTCSNSQVPLRELAIAPACQLNDNNPLILKQLRQTT